MSISNSLELFRDLTLEENLDWLQSILLSIHDGILVIDKEETVRIINPEYTKITGVIAQEIIGKPLKQIRPKAQLIDVLKDGKERVGIYRKEGNTEYVVDMAPIIKDNAIIGAVSVCKGLTEVHKLAKQLKQDRDRLQNTIGSMYQAKYFFEQMIGADGGLKEVIQVGRRAATANLPILLLGESGTGKELFAQSIHNESNRAADPFIPVNCATIPSSLIESELFGYEEGSFTNAKKGGKVGLFEMANGGTLFLDEIGELSQELQAKFLRVLEEGTIRKIGGTTEKSVDVRVIAATNRDLRHLIQKGMFREDLFYRLNVLNINIPPLRDRKEDIPKIIKYVLQQHQKNDQPYTITDDTVRILQSCQWPGNVRELINTMKYAVCMTESQEITVSDLPQNIIENNPSHDFTNNPTLKEVTERAEYEYLNKMLSEYGNSLSSKEKIAKDLSISVATLYNKLKKYQLDF